MSEARADEMSDQIASIDNPDERVAAMARLVDSLECERQAFAALPLKELRRRCELRGVSVEGLLEKDDFVTALLAEVSRQPKGDRKKEKKKRSNRRGGGGGGGGGGLYEPARPPSHLYSAAPSRLSSFASGCTSVSSGYYGGSAVDEAPSADRVAQEPPAPASTSSLPKAAPAVAPILDDLD